MRTLSMKTVHCFRTIQRMSCQKVFAIEVEVGETTMKDEGNKTLERFCTQTAWQVTEFSFHFKEAQLEAVGKAVKDFLKGTSLNAVSESLC